MWGNRTCTKEVAEHPFTDLNNHKSDQQYKHKHPPKYSTPSSTGADCNQTVRPQRAVAAQGSAVCHTNKSWIYAKSADHMSHCWALLMNVQNPVF